MTEYKKEPPRLNLGNNDEYSEDTIERILAKISDNLLTMLHWEATEKSRTKYMILKD